MRIKYEFLLAEAGARAYDPKTLPQLVGLRSELKGRSVEIPAKDFFFALSRPYTRVLIALDEENDLIVGMATLNFVFTIDGCEARLDDVVTLSEYRGNGIGKALCTQLIEYARQQGADSMELTSARHRTAAHNLYRGRGFVERTTSVFELPLIP